MPEGSQGSLSLSGETDAQDASINPCCIVDGCRKMIVAKRMCDMHYRRVKKTGSTVALPRPLKEIRLCAVDGCDGVVHSRDMCNLHYRRLLRFGDPLECGVGHLMEFIDGLLVKDNGDECILWPFSCDRHGYGQIRVEGKPGRAHRLVLTRLTEKPYHYPMQVRHKCGKGSSGCVNPNHLEWGTSADNANDRLRDGTVDFGEGNASAALTNEEAIAIANDHRMQYVIARDYGIGAATVSRIKRGESWGSITGIGRCLN